MKLVMVKEELEYILGESTWVSLKKVKPSLTHLTMVKMPHLINQRDMSKL